MNDVLSFCFVVFAAALLALPLVRVHKTWAPLLTSVHILWLCKRTDSQNVSFWLSSLKLTSVPFAEQQRKRGQKSVESGNTRPPRRDCEKLRCSPADWAWAACWFLCNVGLYLQIGGVGIEPVWLGLVRRAPRALSYTHTNRPSTYNAPSHSWPHSPPCDSTPTHLAPPCSGAVRRSGSTTPTVGSEGGCPSPAKHRKLIITALSDGSFPNDLRVHLNN